MNQVSESSPNQHPIKGGRNLAILGVVSIIIAATVTSISLAIYHNSGDIYLDRSRPGFLPEEGEEDNETDQIKEFTFDKSGPLTIDDVETYLKNLNIDVKAIDSYEDPFSADALSDQNLDIE